MCTGEPTARFLILRFAMPWLCRVLLTCLGSAFSSMRVRLLTDSRSRFSSNARHRSGWQVFGGALASIAAVALLVRFLRQPRRPPFDIDPVFAIG